jgi:hypothetical protein
MTAYDFIRWFLEFWGDRDTKVMDRLDAHALTVKNNQEEILEKLYTMDITIQKQIDDLKAAQDAQALASAKVLGEIKDTVAKLKAAQDATEAAIAEAVANARAADNAEISAALAPVVAASAGISTALAELDAQVEDAEPVVVG